MTTRIRNAERGVKINPHTPFLKRYCQGWLKHLSQYREAVVDVGDWPFWYGERPLVGFLAAGIWSSGGVCIEEFRADKKPHIAKRNKKNHPGRSDLYFCQGDLEGNCELKMYNVGVSQARDFDKFLREKWNICAKDARRGHQRGIEDFGGIFFRPFVGIDLDDQRYEANVQLFLESVWDTQGLGCGRSNDAQTSR
jgi:hypothetical protein